MSLASRPDVNQAIRVAAGWNTGPQGSAAPTASANDSYEVTGLNTRWVAVAFTGTFEDIRFEKNSAATATDFPLLPASHIVFEAVDGDTLNFWNTSGGQISVYCLELS